MEKKRSIGALTEGNLIAIAVKYDVKDDHVCMEHVRAEEPSISTFFESVNDTSSFCDLGNFTNKILSNNEKHQIIDMGPLQPSGTYPKDMHQNNKIVQLFNFQIWTS
ncbi:uncharacterized protein TNCV_1914611 [Trichonephila clavipes]|nr:uncharacterized protein TNCV_1914611 [Trichonephila clavipes]